MIVLKKRFSHHRILWTPSSSIAVPGSSVSDSLEPPCSSWISSLQPPESPPAPHLTYKTWKNISISGLLLATFFLHTFISLRPREWRHRYFWGHWCAFPTCMKNFLLFTLPLLTWSSPSSLMSRYKNTNEIKQLLTESLCLIQSVDCWPGLNGSCLMFVMSDVHRGSLNKVIG